MELTSDDESEFTAMVHRQTRFVFRVACAVLLNGHDAEDAAQETFLKLYRNGGWRGVENERAFLAHATWRAAQDRRPSTTSSKIRLVSLMSPTNPSDSPAETWEQSSLEPSPEQAAVGSDHERMIHRMASGICRERRKSEGCWVNGDISSLAKRFP